MRIIADCHEPAEILKLLRTANGVDGSAVEIETGSLDVGDYLIGPGAVVERKADGDFVASLLDGRMAEQAAKLRATYDKVVWGSMANCGSHGGLRRCRRIGSRFDSDSLSIADTLDQISPPTVCHAPIGIQDTE